MVWFILKQWHPDVLLFAEKDDGIDGIIKDGFNGFVCTDVKEVLNRILSIPDKNKILENAYNTVLELTEEKPLKKYLSNIINKN